MMAKVGTAKMPLSFIKRIVSSLSCVA
jgi:hypothetical protein